MRSHDVRPSAASERAHAASNPDSALLRRLIPAEVSHPQHSSWRWPAVARGHKIHHGGGGGRADGPRVLLLPEAQARLLRLPDARWVGAWEEEETWR